MNAEKNLITLKNLIELKDDETLQVMIKNIRKTDNAKPLSYLLKAVENNRYDDALLIIEDYLRQNRQVAIVYNPAVSALKVELHFQDAELNLFRTDRDEVGKLIHNFQTKYHYRLGSLLDQLLYLRKEKLAIQALIHPRLKSKLAEAIKEYEEYHDMHNSPIKGIMYNLPDNEKRELKRLYRKACLICHPDHVAEKQQEKAQAMFAELHEAYTCNDIRKVRLIAELLEKTGDFEMRFEKSDDADLLRLQIEKIMIQIEEMKEEIKELKGSGAYQTIEGITEEWDDYFARVGETFRGQIKDLENWMLVNRNSN